MVFGEERDRSATTPSEPYYLTRADYFTITDEGVVECYVSGKYGGEDSVINEFSFPQLMLEGNTAGYVQEKVFEYTQLQKDIEKGAEAKEVANAEKRAHIQAQIESLQATLQQLGR